MFEKLEKHQSEEIRLLGQLTRHYLDESPLAVPTLDQLPKRVPRELPKFEVVSDAPKSAVAEVSWPEKREREQEQKPEAPWWTGQEATLRPPVAKQPTIPIPPDVETELAQPTPRKIKYNDKQNRWPPWIIQVGVLCIPHVWIFVLFPILFAATLTSIEADVTGISRPAPAEYRYNGTVSYTFPVSGREVSGTGLFPEGSEIQAKAEKSAKIRVRYSWMFPEWGSSADAHDPCPIPFIGALFGLLLTAGLSTCIWYTPQKHKSLNRNGVPVRGKIVEKREVPQGRGGTIHEIRYQYIVKSHKFEGTMAISDIDFNRATKDAEVTVLYNPNDLHESVVYRYSYYTVKS